jgi:hypothetical protein
VGDNGRFCCTGMTGGPAKIIAGTSGCMELSRIRVLSALAAATFRIGLIMERGRRRSSLARESDGSAMTMNTGSPSWPVTQVSIVAGAGNFSRATCIFCTVRVAARSRTLAVHLGASACTTDAPP